MPACRRPIWSSDGRRIPVPEGTAGNPAISRFLLQKVSRVLQTAEEYDKWKTKDGWLAVVSLEKQERKPEYILGYLYQKFRLADNAVFFVARQFQTGCCYPVRYNNLHMDCRVIRRIWPAALKLQPWKRVVDVPESRAVACCLARIDKLIKNHLF